MYSICHTEGQAGNCGVNCRGLYQNACSIPEEVVFNNPISYDEFVEAKNYYQNLRGTNMKHINDVLTKRIAMQAKGNLILLAIQEINWNNLHKDELLYISDSFEEFITGKATKAYFAEVHELGFKVYNNGRTEATSNVSNGQAETSRFTFALPAIKYLELTGK
jgi:hypothetical protein